MKQTKTLLKLTLKSIKAKKENTFFFGLCGIARDMCKIRVITGEEYDKLKGLFYKNRPRNAWFRMRSAYFWQPGYKRPRIAFLNKLIKKGTKNECRNKRG